MKNLRPQTIESMKIAIFQDKLTANTWVKVFDQLSKQGHQVQGLTLLDSREYQQADVMPAVCFPVKQVPNFRNSLIKANKRKVADFFYRLGWAVPGLNLYWDGPFAAYQLYQEIVRGNYDAIVSGDSLGLSALALALAARKRKIPYLAKIARNRCFLRRKYPLPFYPQPSLRSWVFSQIDVFSVHTSEQVQVLRAEGVPASKIVNIPWAVDTELFRPLPDKSFYRRMYQLPEKSFLLLYVGRLVKLKGLDVLIRAVGSLQDKEVYLMIVGSGPERKALKSLAKQKGLESQVIFTGPIAHNKLPLVYNSADLFVYPGIPWAGIEEQGATVISEAAACRLPAVATKVGGVPECHPKSFLIEPGSVSALTRAIQELKHNKQKRQQISQESYKYVLSNNSLERVVRQYEELFRFLGVYKDDL